MKEFDAELADLSERATISTNHSKQYLSMVAEEPAPYGK